MQKKKLILTILIIIFLAVFFIIFQQQRSYKETSKPEILTPGVKMSGVKMPDFSLKDYDGNVVSAKDFAGKPVVINSWAAWCPFCANEMIDFVIAQKEFGDKVSIVLINRGESLEIAKSFTDKLKLSKDDIILLLDPLDSFYKLIGGFSMPETIFVNKNGDVFEHKRGLMDLKEIRKRIEKII